MWLRVLNDPQAYFAETRLRDVVYNGIYVCNLPFIPSVFFIMSDDYAAKNPVTLRPTTV